MRFGICTSVGSACNSGESTPSHVLISIGVPREFIGGTLRVTFGEENTREDVDFLVDNLCKIVEELKEK
jgi:cysteine desulfurase